MDRSVKLGKCNQSDVQKVNNFLVSNWVSLGLITYPQRHPFQRMKRFAKDRRWKTMKAVNYLSVDNWWINKKAIKNKPLLTGKNAHLVDVLIAAPDQLYLIGLHSSLFFWTFKQTGLLRNNKHLMAQQNFFTKNP